MKSRFVSIDWFVVVVYSAFIRAAYVFLSSLTQLLLIIGVYERMNKTSQWCGNGHDRGLKWWLTAFKHASAAS